MSEITREEFDAHTRAIHALAERVMGGDHRIFELPSTERLERERVEDAERRDAATRAGHLGIMP